MENVHRGNRTPGISEIATISIIKLDKNEGNLAKRNVKSIPLQLTFAKAGDQPAKKHRPGTP